MRQLEKNDKNSKSLLANVLDLEDDFLICSRGRLPTSYRPARPNQLPTILPHSSTFPHAHSEANIASATVESPFYAKISPNISHHPGMNKSFAISSYIYLVK